MVDSLKLTHPVYTRENRAANRTQQTRAPIKDKVTDLQPEEW